MSWWSRRGWFIILVHDRNTLSVRPGPVSDPGWQSCQDRPALELWKFTGYFTQRTVRALRIIDIHDDIDYFVAGGTTHCGIIWYGQRLSAPGGRDRWRPSIPLLFIR